MPSRLPGLVRLVVRARRGVPSTRRARSFYEVIAASLPFDVLPGVNAGDSSCAAHAALRWVPASPASATPKGGLTSPPQAFNLSARPAARMFLAAYPGLKTGADRKSTRLNSSHVKISYAVSCLKKKEK